jgi:nitric oxide reductase subunit B
VKNLEGVVRDTERRELLVSKGWVQAVALVLLFGFFVMGLLAYRTYVAKPPLPARVVDPAGRTLYTSADVEAGQRLFLNNGLMEYGSVFGHGAYLGPDYTADYLRRASDMVRAAYGGPRSDSAARRTIDDFRTNRYDERTGTLRLTAPQAAAHQRLVAHYSAFFSDPTTRHGLRPDAITDRRELAQLTAFFGWTAWASAATRPGKHCSAASDCCSPRSGAGGGGSAGTGASRRR